MKQVFLLDEEDIRLMREQGLALNLSGQEILLQGPPPRLKENRGKPTQRRETHKIGKAATDVFNALRDSPTGLGVSEIAKRVNKVRSAIDYQLRRHQELFAHIRDGRKQLWSIREGA